MLQTHSTTMLAQQRSGALFSLKISPNTLVNPYMVNDHYANYKRAFDAFTALEEVGTPVQQLEVAKKAYENLYDTFLKAQPLRIPIEPLNSPGRAITQINTGLRTYLKKHFGEPLPPHLQGRPVMLDTTSAETSFDIKPSQKQERLALLTSFSVLAQPKPWPLNLLSAYTVQVNMGVDSYGEVLSAWLHSKGLNFKAFKFFDGLKELQMATSNATQPSDKGSQAIEALLRKDA
jgi:hypothetical protein